MAFSEVAAKLHVERQAAAAGQLRALIAILERYRDAGITDPAVRRAVLQIAANLGLSPLALGLPDQPGSQRERRLQTLVVSVCRRLWASHGPSLPVELVCAELGRLMGGPVSVDELAAAVASLGTLGPGISLERLPNGRRVLRDAAAALSSEQGDVLVACDALGFVTPQILADNLGWVPTEGQRVLDAMLRQGLLWLDAQSTPVSYWVPSAI